HDVLAEVGLHHLDALPLEVPVEVHLLGGHRLRLDHLLDAALGGDAGDDADSLGAVGGAVDVHAQFGELGDQGGQVLLEVGHTLAADLDPAFAAAEEAGLRHADATSDAEAPR